MPSEGLRRAYWWGLLLLSSLALLSYAVLGWQARMVADDYLFAYNANRYGLLEGVALAWQQWTGRWAQHVLLDALAAGQPASNSLVIAAHGLLLVAGLAGLLAELRCWCWPTVRSSRLVYVALSSLLVAAVFSLCHVEGLYWAMPALAYVLPMALMLAAASLLLWGLRRTPMGQQRRLWGLGLASLLLFTSGTHEIYALGQVLLLSVAGLAVLAQPKPRRRALLPWIGFAWGVALLGALVFFVAPGNWARLSGSLRPSYDSPLLWLDKARDTLLHRQSLLASGLLFLAFWGGFSLLPVPHALSQLSGRQALLLGGFGLLVAGLWLGIMAVPPMLAYGHVPLRTQPPAMAVLLALSAALALLWRAWLVPHWPLPLGPAYGFLSLLGLLALGLLLANLQRLPSFLAYSSAWDAYDAAIRQLVSEGAREIEVPPMPVRLGISDNEWLHEQRTWLNEDMARYYGLDDIRLNPEIDAVTRVR